MENIKTKTIEEKVKRLSNGKIKVMEKPKILNSININMMILLMLL
jgi:hypothetical protein